MAGNLRSHTEAPTQVGGFPPFQKDTFAAQLLWLTISFALLYVLVAKIGLPRIGRILEDRRKYIADDVASANQHTAEFHGVMSSYASTLSHARNRADALTSRTRQKLQVESKRIRKKSENEFKARLSLAESEINAARAAAIVNVRGIAIEAASAILAQVNGGIPEGSVVADAVDRVLKR